MTRVFYPKKVKDLAIVGSYQRILKKSNKYIETQYSETYIYDNINYTTTRVFSMLFESIYNPNHVIIIENINKNFKYNQFQGGQQ